MNQTPVDAEAMMRESARAAGALFNRSVVLAGENGELRQRVAALEQNNKLLSDELEALKAKKK